VCEILDIFPKEITGMSLPREVDFCINLALGAAPISKAPYRMAPTEQKELKAQLDELISKGYTRPSTLPWEPPVIFF